MSVTCLNGLAFEWVPVVRTHVHAYGWAGFTIRAAHTGGTHVLNAGATHFSKFTQDGSTIMEYSNLARIVKKHRAIREGN